MLKTPAGKIVVTLLFCAIVAGAQTPLAFEVAPIKKAEGLTVDTVTNGKMAIGITIDNAMVHMTSMSLRDLVRYAYRVRIYQVSGPEWLKDERFNVTAKIPAGATREQVPEMVQTMLAERFKLVLHRSSPEVPVHRMAMSRWRPA